MAYHNPHTYNWVVESPIYLKQPGFVHCSNEDSKHPGYPVVVNLGVSRYPCKCSEDPMIWIRG